jgi:UDP-glucose 6-dehydrogenase
MLFDVKNFSATTNNIEVIKNSDIIFTFVATPSTLDGNYDTTRVFEVVADFYTASSLNIPLYDKKFVIGCTTNPGDAEQIQTRLNMFNIQVDNFNKEHANFIKNYYIQKNPDKTLPFVMDYITYKKGTDIIEESQQFQLCVDLLNEGYTLHVIEIDVIANKLQQMSESYNGRLKFFKPGTKPQGYKIDL